jgi:hypothetical protein
LAEKTPEMTESGKGDGYHGTAEQIGNFNLQVIEDYKTDELAQLLN